jgi:bifunctional ADP-heptose synthase (sugar kinase/adenylyltransferase)
VTLCHPEKLDTRAKIVEREAALAHARTSRAAVVTGYFDPLLVDHARRLCEIRAGFDTLIVLLSDPPSPVLDARARAELVAALGVVDYVALPQERASSDELERNPGISVFREEAADEARFERLVEYVHRRQQAPVSH